MSLQGLQGLSGGLQTLGGSSRHVSSGPVTTPVTWGSFTNTQQTGLDLVLTGGNVQGGAQKTTAIGPGATWQADWILASLNDSQAVVVYIDGNNDTDYSFGPSNTYIGGLYNFGATIYWTSVGGSATSTGQTIAGYPVYLRLKKSGTSLLGQFSTDGVSYSTIKTWAGVVDDVTAVYLKGMFANSNAAALVDNATVTI